MGLGCFLGWVRFLALYRYVREMYTQSRGLGFSIGVKKAIRIMGVVLSRSWENKSCGNALCVNSSLPVKCISF